MKKVFPIALLAGLVLLFVGCKKDQPGLSYDIPETYNFMPASYDGQLQRLRMFTELKAYMKTAQTGAVLDRHILQARYTNDIDNAQWIGNYDASKQLRGKTFESEQPTFDALFAKLATDSESTVAGSEGQAGIVTSLEGNKKYLLSATGLDNAQLIEKGLMGACLYYQATGVYFSPARMDVDNVTVTPGEGTDMEHHFDEAFGYFGVPADFPSRTDGVVFWGQYSIERNQVLDSNQRMMAAFLKGRAAISNQDIATRDVAIAEAQANWERIAVGSAIHYLNSTLSTFDDMALRGHQLSEALGFIYALQFNPEAKISYTQIRELLQLVGGTADFATMNLYAATIANLQQAKDQLANYYGLQREKDEL